MTVSVAIEGLSKRFRIGAMREDYATLRDRISGMFRRRVKSPETREIWALRDINFEIGHGEALGLIGHNGAGKSTLLYGRVASLLEVGTGFHPELTGRENIYLNGAILGMTRAEIRHNFDAIVAFAEVEKFLDTPVKRYSSGMFVRLAFAVAAHLTPEILLVDEVLAVGDIEFQRRCLGRMNEVARSGRTVVFVSHNLDSIERLCTRAVLLRGGRIDRIGPAREVVSSYLSERQSAATFDFTAIADREGSGRARITGIEVRSADDDHLDSVPIGETFRVRIHYEAKERLGSPIFGMGLVTPRNERVFLTSTLEAGVEIESVEGTGSWECVVQSPNLLPGQYHFELWITDPQNSVDGFADHLRLAGTLELVPGEAFAGNVATLTYPDRGRIYLDCSWRRLT